MPNDREQLTALAEVARRCHEETERFFRRVANDTQFCYELFRRALAQRSGEAFALLMDNYHSLVGVWVRRHPRFHQASEDAEFFTTAAFERLWIAIPPARFARFSDLRSLLRYLQLCTYSSVTDHMRAHSQAISLEPDDPDSPGHEPAAPEPDLSAAEKAEIWRAVLAQMRSDKECAVLNGCYALQMKPSEVFEEYDALFDSVQDVYRTKQNVLERLRRNAELQSFLAPYA
jgi:hypothetical protein